MMEDAQNVQAFVHLTAMNHVNLHLLLLLAIHALPVV